MNLSKSIDFFSPSILTGRIHIIGCGSVGSTVAELLARFGITKMTLYDFDIVNEHNIVNQIFDTRHINMEKTAALKNILCDINPECSKDVKVEEDGYTGQRLAGYVFLCVDSIELRRQIVESNMQNNMIKAMFDFRTRLTDAQHYAADWFSVEARQNLLNTMQFSHEEAAAETPVSACGLTLGVAPTVRLISTAGVANFINFVKTGTLKKMILIDAFNFMTEAV